MTLTAEKLLPLRGQGLSYQAIADQFQTTKSLVWKVVNGKVQKIRVGVKPPKTERPVFPIWEYMDATEFVEIVETTARVWACKTKGNEEAGKDYLYSFFYTRLEGHNWTRRFLEMPSSGRAGFVLETCRIELNHLRDRR